MSGAVPFLEVNGVELANGLRTAVYTDTLADKRRVQIDTGPLCGVLVDELGGTPTTPIIDNAPWYDPAAPESADFLGLLPTMIVAARSGQRVSTPVLTGMGGTSFGPDQRQGYTLAVSGLLFAASCAGMAYGRAWLAWMLTGAGCDDCELLAVRYRETCPPPGDTSIGEWVLYDAAVDGEVTWDDDVTGSGCCDAVGVSFTLRSSLPHRYRRATRVAAAVPLLPTTTDEWTTAPGTEPPSRGYGGPITLDPRNPSASTVQVVGEAIQASDPTTATLVNQRAAWFPTRRFTNGVIGARVRVYRALSGTQPTHRVRGRWLAPGTPGESYVEASLTIVGTSFLLAVFAQRADGTTIANATSIPFGTNGLPSPAVGSMTTMGMSLEVQGQTVRANVFPGDPTSVDPITHTVSVQTHTTAAGTLLLGGGTPTPPISEATGGVVGVALLPIVYGDYFERMASTGPPCIAFDTWLCGTPDAAIAAQVAPRERFAEVGAIVSIYAGAGAVTGAYVEAWRGAACPPDSSSVLVARMQTGTIPTGATLTIDSSRQEITLLLADGTLYDGTSLVTPDDEDNVGVEWLATASCGAPLCVLAGVDAYCGAVDGRATVTIDTQERAR